MVRRVLVGIALCGAVVCAAALVSNVLTARSRERDDNPFEYRLDNFRKINPSLVRYAETAKVNPGIENPSALAVDDEGTVYVAGSKEVKLFSGDGTHKGGFNIPSQATALAITSEGEVFLGMGDHIAVYSKAGEESSVWTSLGEEAYITSLALIGQDVFVADFGGRVVWRFDRTGRMLGCIGRRNTAQGEAGFVLPSPYMDVAGGLDGSLWVANTGVHRLENYSSDGIMKSSWGSPSMALDGFCGCCNPVHFAVRRDGSFITAEKGLPRIKIYDVTGRFQAVIAVPEQFTERAPDCHGNAEISDLAVDSTGRVLVLDHETGCVRIFTEK